MASALQIPIFVGAGVVRNAWRPVLRAIETQRGHAVSESQADSYLARVVYSVRFLHESQRRGRASQENVDQAAAKLQQVRDRITSEVTAAEASGELSIRPEFNDVLDLLGPREGEEALVCNLNWDSVADRALASWGSARSRGIRVVHLHGQATNSQGLYLPSEVQFEPYRSTAAQREMYEQHARIVNAAPLGSRLILYGLGMHPLDAELCQTVALLVHGSGIEEIVIVNPNHALVAERVRVHLDDGIERSVLGVDPADLSLRTRYDVRWKAASGGV